MVKYTLVRWEHHLGEWPYLEIGRRPWIIAAGMGCRSKKAQRPADVALGEHVLDAEFTLYHKCVHCQVNEQPNSLSR